MGGNRIAGTGQAEAGMRIPKDLRVNPHYPGPPTIIGRHRRNMNCVNCAIAVDDILNGGYPRSALPNRSGEPFLNLEEFYGRDFIDVQTPKHIESLISADRARGIMLGQRPNGEWHVFNVVNKNGNIVFIDGQNGRFADPSSFKNLGLLRTN